MSQRKTGLREHGARKWCRAPTRLHSITFQEDIMIYGLCCGNLKSNFKKLIIFTLNWNSLLPWIRETDETNEKYAIIFMITKTVSID
jgi:hypothetical protein